VATLYSALERRAVFLEPLDQFHVDAASVTARDTVIFSGGDPGFDAIHSSIPTHYFTRHIVLLGVARGQRWLDARSPETHRVLRLELAFQLAQFGPGTRFVLGDLLANPHQITRLVARWEIDHGFHGIAYASCHDPSLSYWAIFEGAELVRLEEPVAISKSDPDLVAVARLWEFHMPEVP